MKILVACEESQAVTTELRKLGHEAYSCDIIECSGGHPEWHIMQDVLPLLNPSWVPLVGDTKIKGIEFKTCDGKGHFINGKWDMILAFPPCTYLTVAGNRYFNVERYGEKAIERIKNSQEAAEFFMQFANADCDKIAIENPVGRMNTLFRKPDQIINPFNFGHPVSKKTCLWLKGLPLLKHTEEVEPEIIHSKGKSGGYSGPSWYVTDENGKILSWKDPRTAKARSKTYPGIAKAMAEQWANTNTESGAWIDWPSCEYVCSVCGSGSGCVEELYTCPNCGSIMRTNEIYPNLDCFTEENGIPNWCADLYHP